MGIVGDGIDVVEAVAALIDVCVDDRLLVALKVSKEEES